MRIIKCNVDDMRYIKEYIKKQKTRMSRRNDFVKWNSCFAITSIKINKTVILYTVINIKEVKIVSLLF